MEREYGLVVKGSGYWQNEDTLLLATSVYLLVIINSFRSLLIWKVGIIKILTL